MRRGRREKPVISIASIEAALKGFGYGSRENYEAATLEALALVDLRLAEMSRPSAEKLRSYAVQSLLADFLLDGFNEQRRRFDLAGVDPKSTRSVAEKEIQDILPKDSTALKAWACLYYRYCRADLAFSVEELSKLLAFSPRNFPRYEDTGLRLLRDNLIAAEWQARKRLLRRLLRRNIPEALVHLIGRETALESANWALHEDPPMPLFITGAEGIGKSAVAAQIAWQLIEAERLDYLLWLSRPKRLEEIYNALEDALLPYPSRLDWRALLGADTLLLVIDDISQLEMSPDEWETLSGFLSPSLLIVTNREYKPILRRAMPLALEELGLHESRQVLAQHVPRVELLDKIPIEEIGGNPALLAYAAQLLLAGYRPSRALDELQAYYQQRFEALAESAQLAWLAWAVGLEIEDKMLPQDLLNPSAKNFLKRLYQNDTALQADFQNYLQQQQFPIQILAQDWLNLDKNFTRNYLENYEAQTIPDLRLWQQLALPYLDLGDFQLKLRYGASLRRLHQAEAESFLQNLVEAMGLVGDFAAQARARYELALLYQSQAQFEKALGHYQAIEAYKQLDEALVQDIYLQYARIAVERGDGALVLNYLQKRNSRHLQDSVLEAEAYFLLGETSRSQAKAKECLKDSALSPQLAASLYTILGRSSKSKASLDYFNAALTIAEQYSSDFDIARAMNNLAVAYIHAAPTDFDEAEHLLGNALKIQARIQDHLGLAVSQATHKQLQRLHITYSK